MASTSFAGNYCVQQLEINYEALKLCAGGAEENYLQYINEIQTAKLYPEHSGVPWILFNKKYI